MGIQNGQDDVKYNGADVHTDNPGEVLLRLDAGFQSRLPVLHGRAEQFSECDRWNAGRLGDLQSQRLQGQRLVPSERVRSLSRSCRSARHRWRSSSSRGRQLDRPCPRAGRTVHSFLSTVRGIGNPGAGKKVVSVPIRVRTAPLRCPHGDWHVNHLPLQSGTERGERGQGRVRCRKCPMSNGGGSSARGARHLPARRSALHVFRSGDGGIYRVSLSDR